MMPTPLDAAHAAMTAAPDDEGARLRFYACLADTEVFLLLEAEPDGDSIAPALFPLDAGPCALVFDREERLSDFTGRASPYAGLAGRALAGMLAGQGIGLGINLGAASELLIPAVAVDWLAATLAQAPQETRSGLSEVMPPRGLPEPLLAALDRKLAGAGGLAPRAYLAAVRYPEGGQGHVLAFVDAAAGAERALAHAVGEALTFSGIAAGVLDVMFLRGADPLADRLARVGLRFDLPAPAEPAPPPAPGSDPAKPPRLR